MSTGKQAVLSCWDVICSALGVSIPLTSDLKLAVREYIRLYLRQKERFVPQLGLALRPELVCVNGQVSLLVLGASGLGLVLSCDLTTKVLICLVIDAKASDLKQHNAQSKLPPDLSLYQIYDKVKVVSAMYLNGSSWTPLVIK